MNRKQYGIYAEHLVITKLLEWGYDVFAPIGDNSRIDLICMVDNFPLRIQVKSQIKSKNPNIACFLTESKACHTKNRHGYSVDEVDCFVFVDLDKNKLFIIKNDKNLPKTISFRYNVPKNNQHKMVNYASDFELCVETLHEIAKSVIMDMLKTKSGPQCESDVVK